MDSQEMIVSRPMAQRPSGKICPFFGQRCIGESCAIFDDEFQICSLKNTPEDEEVADGDEEVLEDDATEEEPVEQ